MTKNFAVPFFLTTSLDVLSIPSSD